MKLTLPYSKNKFPLELVNEVLNYCRPNELSAVALTNSHYRIEAERVLYRSISLNSWTRDTDWRTLRCLSTLAEIQSKANMVKSFELIYIGSHQLSHFDLERLCGSLVAMRSLKHLKLNFGDTQYLRVVLLSLVSTLKSCTFSLATLYIPPYLLDNWILNQNQLKVLEMHDLVGFILQDRQISICRQLSMQNSFPITIFMIAPFGSPLDTIVTYPICSINTRWSAKDIADSLVWATPHTPTNARLQTVTVRPKAHDIVRFKLLLDSLSEEATVNDILTSLAENFLYVKSIIFVINGSRIHLCPSSFSSLHKFPHLKNFRIEYYSGLEKLADAPFHESYLDLASSWAKNCPKLRDIMFPDGRTAAHRDESGHWV